MTEENYLIREAREKVDKLDRAERRWIELGDWAAATSCANARISETRRIQVLMRFEKGEVASATR